jgi:hypothetical protein
MSIEHRARQRKYLLTYYLVVSTSIADFLLGYVELALLLIEMHRCTLKLPPYLFVLRRGDGEEMGRGGENERERERGCKPKTESPKELK